ncbi:hypothetical protein Y1Q_0009306 [Alligator mississippiensis]|uniref:Kinesin motor domain-containing protein n=1 Tax=Alligator mississippiensis TaxID=8496 RepID=A0A151NH92_ALLMI|nr:hypothetical protein Y1Q_0009306 [Alligator mississippiensis]
MVLCCDGSSISGKADGFAQPAGLGGACSTSFSGGGPWLFSCPEVTDSYRFGQRSDEELAEPTQGQATRLCVVVRVRPLSCAERSRGDRQAVQCPGDNTIAVHEAGQEAAFGFGAVFDAGADQAEVFEGSGVKRLVELAVDG